MNNKRSPIEQLLLIALLSFSAFMLAQQFLGKKQDTSGAAPRPTPSLSKAFEGLQGGIAGKEQALAQIADLQKAVETNANDDYAYWAHLRMGLLQQYVLRNVQQAREEYDAVGNRNQNKEVDAQALYQKGDMLWRLGENVNSPDISPEQREEYRDSGAVAFDWIITRSRGDKAFLATKIFVPAATAATAFPEMAPPELSTPAANPLEVPARWEQLSLAQLRGTLTDPDPRGILSRVDAYYSEKLLYRIFDFVVQKLGAQPAYSYGLALIIFAIVTRTLMQPLIKKQYDSMKGMSLIAPEMKKIQEKYKGKTDQPSQVKMMQEIRGLQKSHGVNPMGCGLSLLIQMPIFFLIVLPLINHYQAKFELANASFLWVAALARPDIPLLVLYAISMFVSIRLSATPPADEQQRMMQRMMTMMSPLFALVLWSYPSAFILYWMTYNVLSMFFQWWMMKKSEPDKDLIKTLLGTAPPLTLATDTSTSGAALPPRPSGDKPVPGKSKKTESGSSNKASKKKSEAPAVPHTAADNGASPNGISQNAASKNGEGTTKKKDVAGAARSGGSQRARRRRR